MTNRAELGIDRTCVSVFSCEPKICDKRGLGKLFIKDKFQCSRVNRRYVTVLVRQATVPNAQFQCSRVNRRYVTQYMLMKPCESEGFSVLV